MSVVRKDIENFKGSGWPYFYKVTLTVNDSKLLYNIFEWLHENSPHSEWLYDKQDFEAETVTFLIRNEDLANLTFWTWSQ